MEAIVARSELLLGGERKKGEGGGRKSPLEAVIWADSFPLSAASETGRWLLFPRELSTEQGSLTDYRGGVEIMVPWVV